MVLQYIIYIPTIIAMSVLAGFVGYSNFKAKANKAFVFFVATIILWIIASFMTDVGIISNPTVGVRIIYGIAAFLPFALVYFVQNFLTEGSTLVKKSFLVRNAYKLVAISSLFFSVVSFGELTVKTAIMGEYGAQVKEAGALLTLHVIYYLAVSLYALLVVVLTYKKTNSTEKNNALLLLIGLSFIIAVNIFVNGVLIVFGNSSLGPLIGIPSVLVFVGTVAAGIIKHGLFDVRLLVARTVAYALSLAIMTILYLITIFGVGQVVTLGPDLANAQTVFYLATSLVFAVTLPRLKQVFDKFTNRLFFRDTYDAQVVLDKVSSVIVGNVNPRKIQKGALAALNEAIKSTYMTFLLFKSDGSLQQGDLVGQSWNVHDPSQLSLSLKSIGKNITSFDGLDESDLKVKEVYKQEDIGLIAPLVTKDDKIGYLILGPRKSGNIYNSQDFALLNIATNELAVALQNAQRFDEIQAFTLTLQEKIAEATRELKQTNKKLIALDEAKDEFISMASHQLRTPLTSIKGYLSMMVEGDLGKVSAAQEKALKEAFGSSQRMVYLIADFLNVSRIKTGKFMIETKEVDLPTIVSEEIVQLREMADSRDLTIVYSQPEVFPRVKLDDNKIRQVMMNMVDNAIYYTPAGGNITIQLYATGQEVIFKVVDSGIGVPKSEQHKLFTKFYRAGNARKSRPDGTGLGLFMAQKIVVEQGGAIIFESTEGKGSTFGFRFPLSKIRV